MRLPLKNFYSISQVQIWRNLTNLSHQAQSSTWQQTLTIHPNSNRGTENNNQNNFDTNGNLLNLNNIGNVVFAALVENVGADVQSVALLFCLVD
jgi:insecticidal toxin complex protein TccC